MEILGFTSGAYKGGYGSRKSGSSSFCCSELDEDAVQYCCSRIAKWLASAEIDDEILLENEFGKENLFTFHLKSNKSF